MGLLGNNFDDPQTMATLALAGGLMGGRTFGQGLLGGVQGYQTMMTSAQDQKIKKAISEAQLANYQSEIQARNLATVKDQRQQELIQSVFGKAQQNAVSPGAFVPSADGMGPTMPPQMRPQTNGSVLGSMIPDDIARLKVGGLDLTDIYKFSQEPQKFEQGSTYKDRNTGAERFFAKVGEGVAPGADGFYNPLPGYGAAQASIEGAKAGAVESAKAGFDPTTYTPQGGTPTMTTRKNLVSSMNPPQPGFGAPNGDQFAILSQELNKAQAAGNTEYVASIKREIARLPQGSSTARSESGLVGIPLQSEAEKTKLVDTAKADVVRDTSKQKENKLSGQLTTGLDRAITLLKDGPTASGVGSLMDSTANFFGQSTKGADRASQLDTISGWLTSNVPRMEGPQSDRDLQQYRIMAAEVGDRTKPISQRLAAAGELKSLQDKYTALNGGAANTGGATGSWGDKPAAKSASLSDIAATAKASGKSTAQVTADMRAKGYKIGDQ